MSASKQTRNISLSIESGMFTGIFKRLRGTKGSYDSSDISEVRKILSNERARILYLLKVEKPDSIYQLAKLLKRDFKSVREDIKLLEKFGFEIMYFHEFMPASKKYLNYIARLK